MMSDNETDRLFEFCERLGLSDKIDRMKADKIDSSVITVISDEELAGYIPAFGDRVKVRLFIDQRSANSSRDAIALSPLMVRLRNKIAERNKKKRRFSAVENEEEENRSQKLLGNSNARREVRRVELGWQHYDGHNFKQVRAQNGGGVRHLKDICRSTRTEEILAAGLPLFFPNGENKKGKLEDFEFDVRDASSTVLEGCSIGELYETKKVKILRLYICSKLKEGSAKSTHHKPAKKLLMIPVDDNDSDISDFDIPCGRGHSSTVNADDRGYEMEIDGHAYDIGSNMSSSGDVVNFQVSDTATATAHIGNDPSPCTAGTSVLSWVQAGTPTVLLRATTSDASSQPNSANAMLSPYSTYVELLDDSTESGEDNELQAGILASLEMSANSSSAVAQPSSSTPEILEYTEHLRAVQSLVMDDADKPNTVVIYRSRLLSSAVVAIKRKSFQDNRLIRVEFAGEDAQDYGGPRREFLRLVVKSIIEESRVFEGPPGRVVFSHSTRLLQDGTYCTMGRLLALALSQGGPGIFCMSLPTYLYWTGQAVLANQLEFTLVADYDLQLKVQAIVNATDSAGYAIAIDAIKSWAVDNGLEDIECFEFCNRIKLTDRILRQWVLYRTKPGADEFARGMNTVLHMFDVIRNNAVAFQALFTCNASPVLTRSVFRRLLTYDFSEPGSIKRQREEDTVYAWDLFLQNIEDGECGMTFERLLEFITGADVIPPLGFDKPVTIDFYELTMQHHFPTVSTCDLRIWLPRGVDVDQLQCLLSEAVAGSPGFGKI